MRIPKDASFGTALAGNFFEKINMYLMKKVNAFIFIAPFLILLGGVFMNAAESFYYSLIVSGKLPLAADLANSLDGVQPPAAESGSTPPASGDDVNSSTGDVVADQSNQQVIEVGGDTPGTIVLDDNGNPSTVIVGSGDAPQTDEDIGIVAAGSDAVTDQADIQSMKNPPVITVDGVNQTNTSVSTAGNTSQPASQPSNSGVSTQTAGNETNTALTTETKNVSGAFPIDSSAQISLQKNGIKYVAAIKSDLAQSVEFYAQKNGVPVAFYLGNAILAGDLWQYSFDSAAYPNGNYILYAKIYRKNGNFQSPSIVFSISNLSVDTKQQASIAVRVDETKQKLNSIYEQIDQMASKTADDIAAIAGLSKNEMGAVKSDISYLVKTIQTIEQLKDLLAQKMAQRTTISDEIFALQTRLRSLASDTLETSVNEIVAQIRDDQLKKQNLDDQILIIQEAIDQKQVEKGSQTSSILDLAKAQGGGDINGELAIAEDAVVQNQQAAIGLLRKLASDTDGDGLNDYEETYIYRTNPANPDTDGDGFLDGDEVAHDYNPLDLNSVPGKSSQTVFQDPRKVSPRQTELFKVETVQSAKLANGNSGIKLEGHGLPNSYVTLYIYSQPLAIIVKTDSQGHWEYVLDKSLADGMHTVYAAETNSQGEVQARSLEFVFIKSGDSVMRTTSGNEASMASTIQQLEGDFGFYTVFTIILAVCVAMLIIGFVGRLGSSQLGG